jgi:hypothetical protein
LFDSLAIASMGWVDGGWVQTAYRDMAQLYARGDEQYSRYIWPLWFIFGIELWFNMVFLHREALSADGVPC